MFFRMPSLGDLLFEACRTEAPPEGTGVLTGRVTDPRSGGALAGVTVRVTWEDFRMTPAGVPNRTITGSEVEGVAVNSDEAGLYRICGVPEGRLLRLQVERGERASRADTVRILEFEGARVHDVRWAPR